MLKVLLLSVFIIVNIFGADKSPRSLARGIPPQIVKTIFLKT